MAIVVPKLLYKIKGAESILTYHSAPFHFRKEIIPVCTQYTGLFTDLSKKRLKGNDTSLHQSVLEILLLNQTPEYILIDVRPFEY